MKILICGVGAIGSNLTNSLLLFLKDDEKDHEITVIDKDTVEERNVSAGTQLYTEEQIGSPKVEALQLTMFKWYKKEIKIIYNNFEDAFKGVVLTNEYDLIIDCFDNYNSRLNVSLHCDPEGALLHTGFSNDFTFNIEWDETYTAPNTPITIDICEMEGAAEFVGHVATCTAIAAMHFIENGEKRHCVGNAVTVREVK